MLESARALTVLVVGHNDSKKLLATIERIYNALAVTVEDFSIVVFDDGSTDDTLAVAKAASDKYPFVIVRRNDRRMGPGYCIIAGSREARTPFVVWAPADNTWPLRSFIELFGHLGAVVIAPVEKIQRLARDIGLSLLLLVHQDKARPSDRPAVFAGLVGKQQVEILCLGPIRI